VHEQAIDRTNRIKQTKEVHVEYVDARDTFDEVVKLRRPKLLDALFTFGGGGCGKLGHGEWEQNELVPRQVEALAGKKVVGAASGQMHTAVWTEEGDVFTFGARSYGLLGQATVSIRLNWAHCRTSSRNGIRHAGLQQGLA